MASGERSPRAGVDYPRAWHELTAWFPDDEACLAYLERLRWGDGFVCRFCGTVGGEWWTVRRGMRRCAACRHETSVTAGTIFHGSRLPLNSWFAAVWYVVNQKQGVSALGLQSVLGFGSYQTAWAWLHKLRRAMVLPGREMLTDAVEVDEATSARAGPAQRAVASPASRSWRSPSRIAARRPGACACGASTTSPRRPRPTSYSTTSHPAPRSTPMAGRATSTSAATASSTWSPTCRPAA